MFLEAETFHTQGMPVPSGAADAFARLSAALARTGARTLVILGDLLHIRRGRYGLVGHMHAAVRLRGRGRQRMKLLCIQVTPDYMVLPAFTGFSDGGVITPAADDRVFVVTSQAVIAR